jgi:molybdopterin molybdotransferase
MPPFDRAQMDGYAVRAAEVGRVEAFPVAHTIPAGRPADVAVPAGACVKIATGAPVPADVDAVVPHEESDRADPVRFSITRVEPGRAIHPRGADAKAGDELMATATVLAAHHLGIAAVVGCTTLTVAARPRAVVLTSGDEVVAPDAAPAAHQTRNSNAPQTRALLARCGTCPAGHVHVPDERDATITAVDDALATHDLVVTVGGISAGERDHFPDAFAHHGVEFALRGAAIQPGKPVIVGHAPGGAVVVGLPGNPVSGLVCGCIFLRPIVRRLLGLDPALPWRPVELAAPVRPNPRRRAFRPARLRADGRAEVPAWAGSGDLAHTARTHGVVELPVQDDAVPAGTVVRYLAWP